MNRVFITGVSSGIGEALADFYLNLNYQVYGTSRRTPYRLLEHPNFHFHTCDLSRLAEINTLFTDKFADILHHGVERVFLNAGILGNAPIRGGHVSLDDLQHVMMVNVLANKAILDLLLAAEQRPNMCVISASMAGARFRAGMLPYSVSKAALAALSGVYAEENSDIFFAVLGLCNVKTSISHQVISSKNTEQFTDLLALKKRSLAEGYLVSAAQRAKDIFSVINNPEAYQLRSGIFSDIRTLLRDVNRPA